MFAHASSLGLLRPCSLHDLPDLLSHLEGLGRCRNTPCDLEKSQSRFDLGNTYASLGDNLPLCPLPLIVGGLDVADVVGSDVIPFFARASTTSWFLALWFALRYSRTAWDLFTPFAFAMISAS